MGVGKGFDNYEIHNRSECPFPRRSLLLYGENMRRQEGTTGLLGWGWCCGDTGSGHGQRRAQAE